MKHKSTTLKLTIATDFNFEKNSICKHKRNVQFLVKKEWKILEQSTGGMIAMSVLYLAFGNEKYLKTKIKSFSYYYVKLDFKNLSRLCKTAK